MPRLPPPRPAMPRIRRWTRGACEVLWTRALPPQFRKCHSRQHPLAIAWIAGGEDAQVASVIQVRSGHCCVELILAGRRYRGRQGYCGEQGPLAGIGVDFEFPGGAGFGAYDRTLGVV